MHPNGNPGSSERFGEAYRLASSRTSRDNARPRTNGGGRNYVSSYPQATTAKKIPIDASFIVGLIGENGGVVESMKTVSGARISYKKRKGVEWIAVITGTQSQIRHAESLIEEALVSGIIHTGANPRRDADDVATCSTFPMMRHSPSGSCAEHVISDHNKDGESMKPECMEGMTSHTITLMRGVSRFLLSKSGQRIHLAAREQFSVSITINTETNTITVNGAEEDVSKAVLYLQKQLENIKSVSLTVPAWVVGRVIGHRGESLNRILSPIPDKTGLAPVSASRMSRRPAGGLDSSRSVFPTESHGGPDPGVTIYFPDSGSGHPFMSVIITGFNSRVDETHNRLVQTIGNAVEQAGMMVFVLDIPNDMGIGLAPIPAMPSPSQNVSPRDFGGVTVHSRGTSGIQSGSVSPHDTEPPHSFWQSSHTPQEMGDRRFVPSSDSPFQYSSQRSINPLDPYSYPKQGQPDLWSTQPFIMPPDQGHKSSSPQAPPGWHQTSQHRHISLPPTQTFPPMKPPTYYDPMTGLPSEVFSLDYPRNPLHTQTSGHKPHTTTTQPILPWQGVPAPSQSMLPGEPVFAPMPPSDLSMGGFMYNPEMARGGVLQHRIPQIAQINPGTGSFIHSTDESGMAKPVIPLIPMNGLRNPADSAGPTSPAYSPSTNNQRPTSYHMLFVPCQPEPRTRGQPDSREGNGSRSLQLGQKPDYDFSSPWRFLTQMSPRVLPIRDGAFAPVPMAPDRSRDTLFFVFYGGEKTPPCDKRFCVIIPPTRYEVPRIYGGGRFFPSPLRQIRLSLPIPRTDMGMGVVMKTVTRFPDSFLEALLFQSLSALATQYGFLEDSRMPNSPPITKDEMVKGITKLGPLMVMLYPGKIGVCSRSVQPIHGTAPNAVTPSWMQNRQGQSGRMSEGDKSTIMSPDSLARAFGSRGFSTRFLMGIAADDALDMLADPGFFNRRIHSEDETIEGWFAGEGSHVETLGFSVHYSWHSGVFVPGNLLASSRILHEQTIRARMESENIIGRYSDDQTSQMDFHQPHNPELFHQQQTDDYRSLWTRAILERPVSVPHRPTCTADLHKIRDFGLADGFKDPVFIQPRSQSVCFHIPSGDDTYDILCVIRPSGALVPGVGLSRDTSMPSGMPGAPACTRVNNELDDFACGFARVPSTNCRAASSSQNEDTDRTQVVGLSHPPLPSWHHPVIGGEGAADRSPNPIVASTDYSALIEMMTRIIRLPPYLAIPTRPPSAIQPGSSPRSAYLSVPSKPIYIHAYEIVDIADTQEAPKRARRQIHFSRPAGYAFHLDGNGNLADRFSPDGRGGLSPLPLTLGPLHTLDSVRDFAREVNDLIFDVRRVLSLYLPKD